MKSKKFVTLSLILAAVSAPAFAQVAPKQSSADSAAAADRDKIQKQLAATMEQNAKIQAQMQAQNEQLLRRIAEQNARDQQRKDIEDARATAEAVGVIGGLAADAANDQSASEEHGVGKKRTFTDRALDKFYLFSREGQKWVYGLTRDSKSSSVSQTSQKNPTLVSAAAAKKSAAGSANLAK